MSKIQPFLQDKDRAPYLSREAIIEELATAAALAVSADTIPEYLRWTAQQDKLMRLIFPLNPAELRQFRTIIKTKLEEYGG